MTTQFNSDADFNELVFENRHKDYGAYAIRSTYKDTVAKSMLITFTAVSLLLAVTVYVSNTGSKVPPVDLSTPVMSDYWGPEVILQKPDEPKPKVEEQHDPLPPKTDNPNLEATDDPTKLLGKTAEEMNPGAIQTDSGSRGHDPEPGEAPPAVATAPPVNLTPTTIAEVMPEFIGDVYKFVRDHLQYPQIAIENGTQGTVYLSFIIEKDGSVTEVKMLGKEKDKVGDGCTEEAMRVIHSMPKWKPGSNKGEPVRVVINLPVRFRLKQ
ncbi:MAG: TonB family protein [Bacteroidetes bacterium]|nr:TonB family protein [Bacteroidota bacterium]